MVICASQTLSLDALTLHGENAPLGCEAGQLCHAAALLCEALESCLGRRRFWWTDVVLSKGNPPAGVEELSSGLKLSFVLKPSFVLLPMALKRPLFSALGLTQSVVLLLSSDFFTPENLCASALF